MALPDSCLLDVLSRFPRQRILVAGDVMLDEYLWGTVRRISPEAPVPVVELDRRSQAPGGAANVSGLQAQVHLLGVIGDDEAGQRLCATLAARGIAVDGLLVDEARATTTRRASWPTTSKSSGSITSRATPCRPGSRREPCALSRSACRRSMPASCRIMPRAS